MSTSASTPPPAPSLPPRPPIEAAREWREAFRFRARIEVAILLAMAIVGALLLGLVGPGPIAVAVGCTGILLIAALVLVARSREGARGPIWTAVGALSVLPAYTVGLHSGFACVVAMLLFLASTFDAGHGSRGLRRYGVLFGVCSANLVAFALVAAGVLPDAGNAPVVWPGRPALEPYLLQLGVQALYAAAFAAGLRIDVRHARAVELAEAAARDAAQKEARLRAADQDVQRALASESGGLFAGQRVGPYRLERLLASGGMGEVYTAHRDGDAHGERVAVKLVRRDRAQPVALELFEREASALGRISSPFVARVLDVGGADAELPYIAMELIEGSSLSTLLRARGHLSLDEVRGLVRDVAAGLRAVHSAGIIHRDVKPHNVMLTADREGARWKIVDFGIAELHGLPGGGAALAGTPSYMAPEQALGERVDARADLYALALVAYRALAGRPAFTGRDAVAIAEQARGDGPPDPRAWVALPRDVELALRLGLAARPEDRYATAAELRSAFDAAFEGTLDARHRRRAEALLASAPWSTPRATSEPDATTRPTSR
jgi:serine/threonine-protein kinase